jgi:imidazolonepropionase-like amidohydrolase
MRLQRCLLPLVASILASTAVFAATPPSATSRVFDRSPYLQPTTPVSDDPRRVPVPPGFAMPDGVIAVTNARIFDGTGRAARPGTVVIERGSISAILEPGDVRWPKEARVIDAGGKTVLPGLIDMHVHMTYTEPGVPAFDAASEADQTLRALERLRFFIESGVTSVRDVASHGMVPFRIKEWVMLNRLPLPRVFAAGQLITGTGGHGAEGPTLHSHLKDGLREASGPDDWRQAVREQFNNGADLIKLASHYTREEVAAAVDEAHTLGLKVTVDAETQYIQWAVEAGADTIEHPLPRSDATIALMASKATSSVPTLVPYEYIFDLVGGYYFSTSRRFTFSKEANIEMVRKLRKAGVRIGVGTDLVLDWYRYLPNAYVRELKLLTSAGLSTTDALVAATRTNAEILGLADRLGTIEKGKLADLIVVDGQPDQSLDALTRVELVIRNGVVVVEDGAMVVPPHAARPEPVPGGSAPMLSKDTH